MAEYKEQTVTGKRWQRTRHIGIDLPPGETPVMRIQEEIAFEAGDIVVSKPINENLLVSFDGNKEFPLRNPLDDSLIGSTSTHADLQVLLYSAVRHAQLLRDELNAPE
jgi:hypothetical protein